MFNFHKEGRASITLVGIVCLVIVIATWILIPSSLWWLQIVLTLLALDLLFFILQFFRNPARPIELLDDSIVYAPADGKIVVIEETVENEYLKEKCIQISIFMSPMNVHVNRNPVSAVVKYSQYHPGKYLMAWNPKASTENERTTIAYELKDGKKIVMRQIAGFLARRIVNYLKVGDQVKQGKDMGFIKLGSRVDLFLPLGTEIKVRMGDMVEGNTNVIGVLK